MAFAGTAVFLFYGTLLSTFINLCIWSYEYGEPLPISIAITVFAILSAVGLTLLFMRLSTYFASHEFLPHILSQKQNKHYVRIGLPPLLLAAFAQLFLFAFDFRALIDVILISMAVYLIILLIAFAVQARNFGNHIVKFATLLITAVALFVVALSFFVEFFDYQMLVAVILVVVVSCLLLIVHLYYSHLEQQMKVDLDDIYLAKPSHIHALVLVSKFNLPTIRAISFAKALHPNLEIVSICYRDKGERILQQWKKANISVPLRLFMSSTQDTSQAVEKYIRLIKLKSARDLICVYIPHYTVKHEWEALLHNRSYASVMHRLERMAGVIVSSVPWQR
jgi:hypothetical protein